MSHRNVCECRERCCCFIYIAEVEVEVDKSSLCKTLYPCLPQNIRHGLEVHMFQGVTLAQLIKASVGQADVQRFEPHLGHNLVSCGVFLVKSRHFGLPLAQTTMAKLAISLSRWLGLYTNVEYLQSLYLKRRGQLLFQV